MVSPSLGPSWDPAADSWLSGFAAGEATFGVQLDRGGIARPRFVIGLHAADAAVLRDLREAFGGSFGIYAGGQQRSPKAVWTASSKEALARLLDYFDRFPLRAAKADDYRVWREMVLLYLSNRAPAVRDELAAFAAELQGGRVLRLAEAREATG